MTTYDEWKSTNPEDEMGECDCCAGRARLTRTWYLGVETYACAKCRAEDPDDARDKMLSDGEEEL